MTARRKKRVGRAMLGVEKTSSGTHPFRIPAEKRASMIERHISHPRDGRTPVRDESVLDAMRAVPCQAFVPKSMRSRAERDSPLPIGCGQTISQPYIVALMTELSNLTEHSKVLEIGTGSGYQAAVLSHLTPHVYTIEIIEALAKAAQATLQQQGDDSIN